MCDKLIARVIPPDDIRCRLALARGKEPFSANDLPVMDHGGTGIAGSVFHRLVKDATLARVGHFVGGLFTSCGCGTRGAIPSGFIGWRVPGWRGRCCGRTGRGGRSFGRRN